MIRLMAIVDAGVDFPELEELTLNRTAASIPYGGRYRLVDFPLSNLVNSGVTSVGVFPSYPLASLMDHVGKGKSWDLDRRKDGLFFLPPVQSRGGHFSVGSFAALEEHEHYFTKGTQEYVIVTNCFTICQLDYSQMLETHIKSGADITEAVREGVPLKNYILSKDLLLELIRNHRGKKLISVEDVVKRKRKPYTFAEYEHTGYLAIIDSVYKYFAESMALLNRPNWERLFLPGRPVYTKVKDEPPTRYLDGAKVNCSLIANGSTIEGRVNNCLIGRAVTIGREAKLEKCVIMQQSRIGRGCDLSYVIADKDVHVEDGVVLHGTEEQPVVLRKGARVMREEV